MPWLRLTLECQEQHVEALSHLFEQFDAIAISSEAISDEQLFAGVADDMHYWHRTAISALFDESIDLDILLACARNRIGTDNLFSSHVEAVADTNWVDTYKAEHGELVFAGRLCIRPTWVEPSQDYPATLVLDPGLAFGSGRHNTTSLCLNWLAVEELGCKKVIDYGCGSGILGLAAAILSIACDSRDGSRCASPELRRTRREAQNRYPRSDLRRADVATAATGECGSGRPNCGSAAAGLRR